MSYSPSPSHNFSTLGPIGRTVFESKLLKALRPKQKNRRYFRFAENRSARCRLIAGESNVSLVCSAGSRAGAAGDRNRRDGLAAMTSRQ